jgi:hypothetical protein
MLGRSYAYPAALLGNSLPLTWSTGVSRSLFGDVALVAFLCAQGLDGVFTYVGVTTFGVSIEANPLIALLMVSLGQGTALLGIKALAAMLGIALHILQVHAAVALLTLFYFVVAVLPWSLILFA